MTTTTESPAGVEGAEPRWVDPRSIEDNPDNARRPERDRIDLASSMAELGVLEPPLVRELGDGSLQL